MAELADALDSGSSGRKVVEVQVLLPASWRVKRNRIRVAAYRKAAGWLR